MSSCRAWVVAACLGVAVSGFAGCASHEPPSRIVSLSPGLTENVIAIGAREELLATLNSPSVVQVRALHADVVLGERRQEVEALDLRKGGVQTVLLGLDSLDDLFATIGAVGIITGHTDAAHVLVDRLHARTTALVATVQKKHRRPRVAVINRGENLQRTNPYVARLIELAGGVAVDPDASPIDVEIDVSTGPDGTRQPADGKRAVRTLAVPDQLPLLAPTVRYNETLAWLITALAPLGER